MNDRDPDFSGMARAAYAMFHPPRPKTRWGRFKLRAWAVGCVARSAPFDLCREARWHGGRLLGRLFPPRFKHCPRCGFDVPARDIDNHWRATGGGVFGYENCKAESE